jgi:hypothetical protein
MSSVSSNHTSTPCRPSSEKETQVDALSSLVPELCVRTLPLYLPILLIILIPAMHLKVDSDHCPYGYTTNELVAKYPNAKVILTDQDPNK